MWSANSSTAPWGMHIMSQAQHSRSQPLTSTPTNQPRPIAYINISEDSQTQVCLPHSYLRVDGQSKPSAVGDVPRYVPVTWGNRYPSLTSRNQAKMAGNKELVPPFVCDAPASLLSKNATSFNTMAENHTTPQGRLLSAPMRCRSDAGVLASHPSSQQPSRALSQAVEGRQQAA